jgi:periplasmic protein TonB
VSLTVDAEGNPKDVHLIKSSANTVNKKLATELDEKSIKAVKQYRFQPGTYQGKPVPVELNVEVNFQIF